MPSFRVKGSHPLWPAFPCRSSNLTLATSWSRNPCEQAHRFRLLRVRSPLLTQSRLMSFPAGTEMFHFPAYGSAGLCVQTAVISGKTYWIAPFGNPRIKVYLPLPEAYRSLSRPSSPDGAKASVVRPYTLSRKILIKLKPSRSVYVAFFFPETFNCQRSKNSLKPSTACKLSGGRAWNRTRDLVLIRDAL